MQKKIESFFKPSSTPTNPTKPTSSVDDLFNETCPKKELQIRIKYTRKSTDSTRETGGEEAREKLGDVARKEKVLNKKRSYAQFHLDLGQSDFLLHTCKICGIKYAKGDEEDEKVHNTFHKNYTLGIPFKGWRHENVIQLPSLEKDRVLVVLNSDPPAQRKKVQEVVKMMEIELSEGWIFHELCKVYLYISSQRVAGCVVAEPISTAHKILSDSEDKLSDDSCGKEAIPPKATTLQFGGICFQREVSARKGASNRRQETLDSSLGSIVCGEEAFPACCGIRAIWVSPSNRRKHLATHLLDAVRKTFCEDYVIEHSQLAFSQPTSAGKALASKYTGQNIWLVDGIIVIFLHFPKNFLTLV